MADFAIRYNGEHLHSGINYVTPKRRHEDEDVERCRKETLQQTRTKHPERWNRTRCSIANLRASNG